LISCYARAKDTKQVAVARGCKIITGNNSTNATDLPADFTGSDSKPVKRETVTHAITIGLSNVQIWRANMRIWDSKLRIRYASTSTIAIRTRHCPGIYDLPSKT
jgi:hypothetical protein